MLEKEIVKKLRSRIREFEDRKISGADLGREIFHVAREVDGIEESGLRRSLEGFGNRVIVLAEQGLTTQVHPKILEVVDQVESELTHWGY